MGKSTISMAIFNSFLYVYQAGYHVIFEHVTFHMVILRQRSTCHMNSYDIYGYIPLDIQYIHVHPHQIYPLVI